MTNADMRRLNDIKFFASQSEKERERQEARFMCPFIQCHRQTMNAKGYIRTDKHWKNRHEESTGIKSGTIRKYTRIIHNTFYADNYLRTLSDIHEMATRVGIQLWQVAHIWHDGGSYLDVPDNIREELFDEMDDNIEKIRNG